MTSSFEPKKNAPAQMPPGRGLGVDAEAAGRAGTQRDSVSKPGGPSTRATPSLDSVFDALAQAYHNLACAKVAALPPNHGQLLDLIKDGLFALSKRRESYESGALTNIPAAADRSLDGPNVAGPDDAERDGDGVQRHRSKLRPAYVADELRRIGADGRDVCRGADGDDNPDVGDATTSSGLDREMARAFFEDFFFDCGVRRGSPDIMSIAMFAVGAALVERIPAASGVSEAAAAKILGWSRKRVRDAKNQYKRRRANMLILDPIMDHAAQKKAA